MTDRFEHLRAWVGKTERKTDTLSAWPVTALAATLDHRDFVAAEGTPIPAGWHWLYFLEAKPASELGDDGHPRKGGFLPPVPLPRRMWAGGRIEFLRPLSVGEAVTRDSEIVSVEPKSGRTGDLVFVTVRHTIRTAGVAGIVEEHDIVYREAAKAGDPAPAGKPAPASAEWTRRVEADAVLLFRYSALTFNGHRIHYDKDYATRDEHYNGLVVHGPLQATLLLDLCRLNAPRPLRKFEYRAQSPLFGGDSITVNGTFDATASQAELWTAGSAGTYAMRGTAWF
jgi:3-methylfumaryl-CoA hydratase